MVQMVARCPYGPFSLLAWKREISKIVLVVWEEYRSLMSTFRSQEASLGTKKAVIGTKLVYLR